VGDVPEPRARLDPRNQAEPALAPFNLREAVRVLRRHPWIFLGLTGVALGVATFLALRAEPVYRATAVIRLADARGSLTGKLVENPTGPTGRSLCCSQLEVLRAAPLPGPSWTAWVSCGSESVTFQLAWLSPGSGCSGRLIDYTNRGRVHSQRSCGRGAGLLWGHVEMDGVGFTVRVSRSCRGHDSARPAMRLNALLAPPQIRLRENTDVVDVTHSAADPERAQEVVNRVVRSSGWRMLRRPARSLSADGSSSSLDCSLMTRSWLPHDSR
jgi:hypothetical protein